MDAIAWMLNPPRAAVVGQPHRHRIEVEEDAIPFGENEGPGTTAQRSGHVTRRREVLKLLQSEPVCTARQIGTHVGVNLRTAHRYVHELREQGHTIAGRRGEGFVYERKV